VRRARAGTVLGLAAACGGLSLAWTQPAEQAILQHALRGHVEFLASDALRGRGSGTHDEWVAATYVAGQLRQLGLEPAGDEGGYLQRVELERHRAASPAVTFRAGGPAQAREKRFTHGQEVVVARLGAGQVAGPLRRLRAEARPAPGDVRGGVVLLDDGSGGRRAIMGLVSAGASAVLVPAAREEARFSQMWAAPIATSVTVKGLPEEPSSRGPILLVDRAVLRWLADVPEGARVEIGADLAPPEAVSTWNVLATLKGSGPEAGRAVLLSAHIDHLGTSPTLSGDTIFNGADDDASGVAAALELARALVRGGPGRRTALFGFFGSEESGGLGSRYFLHHPPVPLEDIVANLQFEMLGRPDPAVPPGSFWLTGFERSDLGPALAREGAPLLADPHPEENFFRRSDNYRLAQRGVVAHTVSSFGLHADYHGVDDEVDRLDFTHLAGVATAMVRPVRWLLDSAFVPSWKDGPP
jgi:aminopeptidase YwaD